MASGDPVQIFADSPPAANQALTGMRAGGSTPAERFPVLGFDAGNIEYWDYHCRLDNYANGGLTFVIEWMAATATTGVVRWEAAIRANPDDAEDVDAAHTYDYNAVDDTTASASGESSRATITFTNGADMDNLANGETFVLRIRRNASHANDTMAGDAQIKGVFGRET